MKEKKIKAIAFDLDHTLYDRYGTLRSIAYLLKQRYRDRLNPALSAAQIGDMLVEADKNHIYDGWRVMFEELLAWGMFVNPPSFEEYFAFFMEAFQKIAVPFPMVDDMLAGFQKQGYKVGLLTNGEAVIQRGKVKLIGLENSFDKILAIFFDNSFAVFHDDSANRARPDAGFAADALFLINLCSHFSSS